MPEHQTRDITTRTIQIRAATLDEQGRSVEAVIATETPATVMDWRTWEPVDEVLRADGANLPSQMPLLAAHQRWNLDGVLGSIRNVRSEGEQIVGRLYFAEGDVTADRAWSLVRQGHLTDVSVGYRVENYVDVPPGKSQVIKGRTYTAGQRTLRITTDWTPREGSLVPIGADPKAKVREDSTVITQEETPPMAENQNEGQRADDTPAMPVTPPAAPAQPDEAAIRQQALDAERARVRSLRELAGSDVPAEVLTRAIDDGWDETRASREFLTAVRSARQTSAPSVPYQASAQTAPMNNATARSLAVGMMLGAGISDPTKHAMHTGRRDPEPRDRLTAQDAEQGQRFARMSAIDIVRQAALLDTGRLYWDPSEAFEAIRSTPSGGTLSYVFTTNVYARLLAGWETVGDTTTGWCDEEDVANFLSQEDISLTASAALDLHSRGGTAKHATVSDSHETYKIARYSKQFVMDEMDVIDDRLGALMRMPSEMGEAARQLRPDLVYSLMLENPAMTDTGNVFNSTAVTSTGGHANLGTGALSSTNMKTAITSMLAQRLNRTSTDPGRALTIRPKFLIVPPDLEWTARELTASAALAKLYADTADPWYSQLNLLAQEGMRVVVDGRIDAVGVMDPKAKTVRVGTATNWFMAQGGSRGLKVAYRRGTNRQPQMRSFVLDKGQWGMGWDVVMDLGVAFTEYRTWYKSTGAG